MGGRVGVLGLSVIVRAKGGILFCVALRVDWDLWISGGVSCVLVRGGGAFFLLGKEGAALFFPHWVLIFAFSRSDFSLCVRKAGQPL